MDISLTAFARYAPTSQQPARNATAPQSNTAPMASLAAFSPDRLKTTGNSVSVLQSLSDLSSGLTQQKSQVDQSISLVRAGQSGATSAMALLARMKGLVQDARRQGGAGQAFDTSSFNDLAKQLNTTIGKSSYQGLNLVNDSTASLSVSFKNGKGPPINISGANLNASALLSAAAQAKRGASAGVYAAMAAAAGATNTKGFSTLNAGTKAGQAVFDKLVGQLDSAISTTQATASRFAKNLGQLAAHPSASAGSTNLDSTGAGLLANHIGQQLGSQYGGNLSGAQWTSIYAMLR